MKSCPLCGKPARTEQGLRRHLTGTIRYGGHALGADNAAALARDATPTAAGPELYVADEIQPRAATPVRAAGPLEEASFLEDLFGVLLAKRHIPKMRVEPLVDLFLTPFLPEIVGRLLGCEVEYVVPEFPLKKDNNQSTNVDHLLFQRDASGHARWIFFELKTDQSSVSHMQLDRYLSAMELGMPRLVDDVGKIRDASKAFVRYAGLIETVMKRPLNLPIRLVYLAPVRLNELLLGSEGKSLTFSDLHDLELEAYPQIWTLLRDAVLRRL